MTSFQQRSLNSLLIRSQGWCAVSPPALLTTVYSREEEGADSKSTPQQNDWRRQNISEKRECKVQRVCAQWGETPGLGTESSGRHRRTFLQPHLMKWSPLMFGPITSMLLVYTRVVMPHSTQALITFSVPEEREKNASWLKRQITQKLSRTQVLQSSEATVLL